jgi:hypothetical protein
MTTHRAPFRRAKHSFWLQVPPGDGWVSLDRDCNDDALSERRALFSREVILFDIERNRKINIVQAIDMPEEI